MDNFYSFAYLHFLKFLLLTYSTFVVRKIHKDFIYIYIYIYIYKYIYIYIYINSCNADPEVGHQLTEETID